MTKVKLIGNLAHDGVTYKAGDTFEGDKAVVENLIALGAARDPKEVEPDLNDTSVEDAEVKASEILEAAYVQADKVTTAAHAEALTLTAEAKETAAKVVAEAKAEAESIITDAQAKAKEVAVKVDVAAAPKTAETNQKVTTDSKSK
jgi:vacuolar-type H+-ATPase subunit H